MPRSPRPSNNLSNLSASLHQQLNTYALAAGAAGVSLLALAQPSEAEIVYTPAHGVISRDGSFKIDLNNDGIVDFIIAERAERSEFRTLQFLAVKAAEANEVKCVTSDCISTFTYAAALRSGAEIGEKGQRGWITHTAFMAFEELFENGSIGYAWGWVNVSDRYLGLKFQINGETHFGWARLSVIFHRGLPKVRTWEAHLTGYAYETIAGKSIKAGQTIEETDDDAASPKPAHSGDIIPSSSPGKPASSPAQFALGALALGANGLALLRREESEITAKS
jgi:hypothetical protein